MSTIASHEVTITLYLDLMKRSLLNTIYAEHEYAEFQPWHPMKRVLFRAFLQPLLRQSGARIVMYHRADAQKRARGADWPAMAHTMIGLKRLENIQYCAEQVLAQHVPGDFIETGVWRGGATIFMRAILKAHGVTDRNVWVADSFAGLPKPETQYIHDQHDRHHTYQALAVSLEQVQENFRKYGLLDDQVRFLKGWFKDTLPQAPIEQVALLRLDGDMYQSTIDALNSLYHRLSVGGFVIVDDYTLPGCRAAIHAFRDSRTIHETMTPTEDGAGVYWQRTG